jgi:hypothetical protein
LIKLRLKHRPRLSLRLKLMFKPRPRLQLCRFMPMCRNMNELLNTHISHSS